MAEEPLVTTVIATFRRPAFLRRAIHSALRQTIGRVRVSVYDNASGDDTADVVRQIGDDRITYHHHDRNIGASANYNFGLSRVTTPYFSLLGDDDLILPDLYRTAVHALERDRGAMFFCARTAVDNRRAGVVQLRGRWAAGTYDPSAQTATHMVRDHFINTGIVFRTAVLESVGYFDELGSDRNYVVIASALHRFIVTERDLAVMTVHKRSFSGGGASTDFGAGTTWSWGGEYVMASHRALLHRMQQMPGWTPADHERFAGALRQQTRGDLLYVAATTSQPSRFHDEIAALRANANEVRFPVVQRLVLAAIDFVTRVRPLNRLLYVVALAMWRLSKRRASSEAGAAIAAELRALGEVE